MNKNFFQFILLVGFLPMGAVAGTINLTPGDTLRVDFGSNPATAPCPSSSCDVLALFLVLSAPESPGVLATASLQNGGTLLGTTTADPILGLEFRSASSTFTLGTIIDFSSLGGPFSGYFYVTATNSLSIDTALTNVDLGHATGSAGFSSNPATAQISSITLVPEPQYAGVEGTLLCCAVVSRFIRLSRRRRERSSQLRTIIQNNGP
jgi:hypothetical protein